MPSEARASQEKHWLSGLESALERTGAEGAQAARYLREHRIHIGVRRQSAGARWTVDRRIEIHPRYFLDPAFDTYALSLVIHEVRHLWQGALTALSVYGELDAWQVQFGFLDRLSVGAPGADGQRAVIRSLLALPLGWDRTVLRTARRLMREYAGKAYRVDLLPLYPMNLELAHVLTRRIPGQA